VVIKADPTHDHDGASSPEQDLIVAILLQALRDLSCEDKAARDEAALFWSARSGEWARHRRLLLSCLGIDDDAALDRIRHLIPHIDEPDQDAPAPRREVVWRKSPTEVRVLRVKAILPAHDFTADWIAERLGDTTTGQVVLALRRLIEQGVVSRLSNRTRTSSSIYCRTQDLLPLRSAASR